MTRRVALYGGSFNPPHDGHQTIMEWLAYGNPIGFDEVWVLPAVHHAFSKDLPPYEIRALMVEAVIEEVECFKPAPLTPLKVIRREEVYTVDLLRSLHQEHPETDFYLVVGGDVLHDSSRWKEWDTICDLATLVPVVRPGYEVPPGAPAWSLHRSVELSSSDIRARIENRSLTRRTGDGELPFPVWFIIEEQGLYGG